MSLEIVKTFLLWSSVINIVFLLLAFLMILVLRKPICEIHCRLFKISEKRFNRIIYSTLAAYKMIIVFFNVVPYIALRITTG